MSAFRKKAKIISNRRIKGKFFHCILHQKAVSSAARPGQFLNIKVSDGFEPLLRRPLSIHRVKGQNIELLYEALGTGTEILSQRKPGEFLDLIGPLGNGFDYEGRGTRDERRILVAGGMGVAPLLFLAEKLKSRKAIALIGAKNKNLVLCADEFRSLGCEVKIATDNGSLGYKGKVTELLKKILLSAMSHQLPAIYACGPRPMLKEIIRISLRYDIPAQISLEEHMACGIGACLGCVVKTKDEGRRKRDESAYKRACKEGPVFDASEIIW